LDADYGKGWRLTSDNSTGRTRGPQSVSAVLNRRTSRGISPCSDLSRRVKPRQAISNAERSLLGLGVCSEVSLYRLQPRRGERPHLAAVDQDAALDQLGADAVGDLTAQSRGGRGGGDVERRVARAGGGVGGLEQRALLGRP